MEHLLILLLTDVGKEQGRIFSCELNLVFAYLSESRQKLNRRRKGGYIDIKVQDRKFFFELCVYLQTRRSAPLMFIYQPFPSRFLFLFTLPLHPLASHLLLFLLLPSP